MSRQANALDTHAYAIDEDGEEHEIGGVTRITWTVACDEEPSRATLEIAGVEVDVEAVVAESAEKECSSAEHEPGEGSDVWGYADAPDADVWRGICATREEAIAEARIELHLEPGASVFVMKGRIPSVAEFLPDADSFLENMGERAQDECGEAAEEFPDVSDAGRAELEVLLGEWAKKHIDPIRFWVGVSDAERVEPSEV